MTFALPFFQHAGRCVGGVMGYSAWTWEPIVKLIALLEESGISVPPVEPFLKSRLSEQHGWGDPFTRDNILAG